MLVCDFHRYLQPIDDATEADRHLGRFLMQVVQAATARPAGTPWRSALSCRLPAGRGGCPGRVMVQRTDIPGAIGWRCPICRDDGQIVEWAGSGFDLRVGAGPVPDDRRQWPVPYETVAVLRALDALRPDSARVLFAAVEYGPCAVVGATDAEFEDLIDTAVFALNHAPRSRRHELRTVFEQLSQLLVTQRGRHS